MTALRSRRGFSLIEVLMAMAVLAIGLAGIFSLFGIATTTHRRATDQANVGLIAGRARAEVQSRFAAGNTASARDLSFPEFPGYSYDLDTERLPGLHPRYAVKVTVKWQFRGRLATETFESVMVGTAAGK